MKYMLDTNICIFIIKKDMNVLSKAIYKIFNTVILP